MGSFDLPLEVDEEGKKKKRTLYKSPLQTCGRHHTSTVIFPLSLGRAVPQQALAIYWNMHWKANTFAILCMGMHLAFTREGRGRGSSSAACS